MRVISYILLGLTFLTSTLSYLSFKRSHATFDILLAFILSLAIINARTDQQMLADVLWTAWVLVFTATALISGNLSKGSFNLYENKFVLWGLFVSYNVIAAFTRFVLCA